MNPRCYLPKNQWHSSPLTISGSEAHHLVNVLRVSPQALVTCFDGEGKEALGIIRTIGRRELTIEIKEEKQTPLPSWAITLAAAVPGNENMEQIIDEATQLGVRRIVPLLTDRTIIKLTPDRILKKQDRWQQIAVSAAKQSEVNFLPVIEPLSRWKDFLPSFASCDCVLIATPDGPHEALTLLIRSLVQSKSRGSLLMLIGPEGDFTPQEITQAVHHGAHRISLGQTVLRCETAVTVAVALVSFLLRDKG